MLRAVTVAEQWRRQVEPALPSGWEQATVVFRPSDPGRAARAAFLLGPLNPGRKEGELVFTVVRRASPGLQTVRRLLAALDEEGIAGELDLLAATVDARPEAVSPAPKHRPLVEAWDELAGRLPEDWSDLVCVVELTSSDDLAPAALSLAPLNPSRHGATPAFRFRVARRLGYGAAPQVARRCLARLDEQGIGGRLSLLHELSAADLVATQGPVWRLAGRAV